MVIISVAKLIITLRLKFTDLINAYIRTLESSICSRRMFYKITSFTSYKLKIVTFSLCHQNRRKNGKKCIVVALVDPNLYLAKALSFCFNFEGSKNDRFGLIFALPNFKKGEYLNKIFF